MKKYYPLIYILLTVLVGFLLAVQAGSFKLSIITGIVQTLFYAIIYLGIGTLSYRFILKKIENLMDKLNDKNKVE